MSEDARENRRTWILSVGMLVGVLALLTAGFELRVRYANADAMDGYALVGDHVLVVDRLYGGGESSPPGGARIFRLDRATGQVATRKRVSESLSFVAAIDGRVWMRVYEGAFESFDLATLERSRSEKELLQQTPALRALVGVEHAGCFDAPMGAYRFTDESGKYVAFRFRDEAVVSVPTPSCPPQRSVEASSGKLGDGRTVSLKNLPNGKRDGLFIGDTRVGTLSYLEAHLLSMVGDNDGPAQLLSAKGNDVFAVRRTGTRSEDPTEVVRVELPSGTEKWSARIDDQRTRVEQADIQDGRLFIRNGKRLSVIDVDSGAIRWQRGN